MDGVLSRRALAATPIAFLCAGCALGLVGRAAAKTARPLPSRPRLPVRLDLTTAPPSSTSVGDRVALAGHVSGAPAGSRVALELKPPGDTAGSWRLLEQVLPRRGMFSLSWRPATGGFMLLRVTVVRHGRDLTSTSPSTVLVGPPPVHCAPPVPPGNIPAGDGWIVGGLYNTGGPAPGIHACADQAYTLTVTDAAGATVATVQVPVGQSYTVVLPAGGYTLRSSGFCSGTATVTAGKQTVADTVCLLP